MVCKRMLNFSGEQYFLRENANVLWVNAKFPGGTQKFFERSKSFAGERKGFASTFASECKVSWKKYLCKKKNYPENFLRPSAPFIPLLKTFVLDKIFGPTLILIILTLFNVIFKDSFKIKNLNVDDTSAYRAWKQGTLDLPLGTHIQKTRSCLRTHKSYAL